MKDEPFGSVRIILKKMEDTLFSIAGSGCVVLGWNHFGHYFIRLRCPIGVGLPGSASSEPQTGQSPEYEQPRPSRPPCARRVILASIRPSTWSIGIHTRKS